jgi:hypothetical protein
VPTYDASDAEVSVYVRRDPNTLLASLGHDLEVAVREFTIDLEPEAQTVTARFEAESLEPVDAIDWETRERTEALSDGDREDISGSIADELLEVDRFPAIIFESTDVKATDEGWRVTGDLELHGQVHAIAFDAERQGGRAVADVTLDYTRWGIDQYSALLGALKVGPELVVTIDVPVGDHES